MTSNNQLLTLNHMAKYLGKRYGRTIADTTPYWWWKMEKAGKLPVNMPKPVQTHGQSPLFDPDEASVWYANYLDAIDEPYDVVNPSTASSPRRSRKKSQSK